MHTAFESSLLSYDETSRENIAVLPEITIVNWRKRRVTLKAFISKGQTNRKKNNWKTHEGNFPEE